MKNIKNDCISVDPNLNLRPGSILIHNKMVYLINENNTACVIGVSRGRGKKKISCPTICMTGSINPQGTQSEPCSLVRQVLKGGSIFSSYTNFITPIGGTAPYTYSVISGALPPNCTFGVIAPEEAIQGTQLQQVGNFLFTLKVTDSNGCFGTQDFSIQVLNPA